MVDIERHATNVSEFWIKQFDAGREDGLTNAGGAPLTLNLAYNSQAGNTDGITEADEAAICNRAIEMVRAAGYAIRGSHPADQGGEGQFSGEIGAQESDL